jgi:hypothetical protein
MHQRLTLSIALLALSLTAAAFDWRVFEDSDGRFSIAFPGEPEVQVLRAGPAEGAASMSLYIVRQPTGVLYMLTLTRYPAGYVAASTREELIREAIDGAMRNVGGTLLNVHDLEVGGLQGRATEMLLPGGLRAFARFTVDRDLLYSLYVIAPDRDRTARHGTFFDSFKLSAAADG